MALRRRAPAGDASAPAPDPDLVAIADAVPRQRITVAGQVVRMRSRPTTGQPSLAVTISDDTGSITAVWTGRRAIGGITLGRRLLVRGVAAPAGGRAGGRLELINPAYTLLP